LLAAGLAIIVLMTTQWAHIRPEVDRVADAVDALAPGDYVEPYFPRP